MGALDVRDAMPWLCLAAALFLGAQAPAARAESAAPDPWQSSVTVYGFFPSVRVATAFPGGGAGPSFHIRANEIISNLNFAAMGSVQFHKGRWGGLVDLFYADLSDSRHGSRDFTVPQVTVPVNVSADLDLGTKTTLLTLAGTWQFITKRDLSTRLVFGARMNHERQRLDWTLSAPLVGYPEVSGQSRVGQTNWDGIVGISGRWKFGQDLRWYVPFYADAGTGDSRFTGQALAGVGYAFDWGEVTAAWRYIDYEFKSGSPIRRISYSGLAVGFTWRF